MASGSRIFVQIPSYKDPELIPTLLNMIKEASNPERLRLVVCWQHAQDEVLQDFMDAGIVFVSHMQEHGDTFHRMRLWQAQIELIDVSLDGARGCGWARQKIQKHYDNERYALQLDSHHRFVSGWDSKLIEMIEDLRDLSPRPVLTCHPPPYEPLNDPQDRMLAAMQINFSRFTPPGVVAFKSTIMADWEERDAPMRARFAAGGFLFSDGSFVKDVPNDGAHFFATEEIVTAIRAFTHGYDLYHPHRVILWHYYKPRATTLEIASEERSKAALDSYLKTRAFFSGKPSVNSIMKSEFGLGQVRTLQDYEQYAGISLKYQGLAASIVVDEPGGTPLVPHQEWEQNVVCHSLVNAQIEPNLFTDFNVKISIAVYMANGEEICRKRLSEDEIASLSSGETYKYMFSIRSNPFRRPNSYNIEVRNEQGLVEIYKRHVDDEFLG